MSRYGLSRRDAMWCLTLSVVMLTAAPGCVLWEWLFPAPRYKPRIVDVYYMDLATGKVFKAASNMIPPIAAPSHVADQDALSGVRAYLYACGDCPRDLNGATREELTKQKVFVGWLEMYTLESKNRMEALARGEIKIDPNQFDGPELFDFIEQGHLVKSMDADAWVPANSEPGFAIMQRLQNQCGGDIMPKPCFPPRK